MSTDMKKGRRIETKQERELFTYVGKEHIWYKERNTQEYAQTGKTEHYEGNRRIN